MPVIPASMEQNALDTWELVEVCRHRQLDVKIRYLDTSSHSPLVAHSKADTHHFRRCFSTDCLAVLKLGLHSPGELILVSLCFRRQRRYRRQRAAPPIPRLSWVPSLGRSHAWVQFLEINGSRDKISSYSIWKDLPIATTYFNGIRIVRYCERCIHASPWQCPPHQGHKFAR